MSADVVSKDKSMIIKGIAILFMIAHHCLIKEFYIDAPDFLLTPLSRYLQTGNKMCVGLFTFFIGYGSFYAKSFDTSYVTSRIWRLTKQYWLILFFTVLIAFAFTGSLRGNTEIGGGKLLLLNALGLRHEYNLANWYIYFYVYALFVLSIIFRLCRKRSWTKFVVITLTCGFISYNINSQHYLFNALDECLRYTPTLMMGYLCAKTQILSDVASKMDNRYVWLVIAVLAFVCRCYSTSIRGFVTDVVFVPVFVLSLSMLFIGYESSVFSKSLTVLGRNSTLMWFFHVIPLSDATRKFFQDSPFWINNVLVQFMLLTILSYIVAWLLNKLFYKLNIISKK